MKEKLSLQLKNSLKYLCFFFIEKITKLIFHSFSEIIFYKKSIIFNLIQSINGYLISMTAISGVFGSILAGFIVDKNKRFNEVIKSCYIGIAICASAICLVCMILFFFLFFFSQFFNALLKIFPL